MQSVCMATSRQDIWSPVGALVEAVALSAVAKISAWVTNMLTSTPEFRAVLRMLHDSGFEVTPIWLEKHMDLYHEGKRKLVLEQMLDRSSPTHEAVVYMVSMVSAAARESE